MATKVLSCVDGINKSMSSPNKKYQPYSFHFSSMTSPSPKPPSSATHSRPKAAGISFSYKHDQENVRNANNIPSDAKSKQSPLKSQQPNQYKFKVVTPKPQSTTDLTPTVRSAHKPIISADNQEEDVAFAGKDEEKGWQLEKKKLIEKVREKQELIQKLTQCLENSHKQIQ